MMTKALPRINPGGGRVQGDMSNVDRPVGRGGLRFARAGWRTAESAARGGPYSSKDQTMKAYSSATS